MYICNTKDDNILLPDVKETTVSILIHRESGDGSTACAAQDSIADPRPGC